MRDDVEVLGGGELLVSGVAVGWFATLAERAVAGQRLNGVRNALFEAWARDAAGAASLIRTAAGGRSAVPIEPDRSSSALIDPVGTKEASQMLGCKERNVRDLQARGHFPSARQVGGRWQYERAEVLARIERGS